MISLLVPAKSQQVDEAARLAADKRAQEPMNRKVNLRLEKATLDDQIIELARAADANFIADATHFAETTAPVSGEWEYPLSFLVSNLADAHNLSRYNKDARTFLFWSQPDMLALAHKIVAGESVKRVSTPPDDRALDALLSGWLQRTYGWDGRAPGFVKDIRIAELPPEIRTPVMAWAQEYLSQDSSASALGQAWFTDAAWKGASLWNRGIPSFFKTQDTRRVLWVGLGGTYSSQHGVSGGQQSAIGLFADPAQK